MSRSISPSNKVDSVGSFERSIENFIETSNCFNYIGEGGIENADVIQINLDYLKNFMKVKRILKKWLII